MTANTPPARSEAAEYYFRYIDLVPPGEIGHILETQMAETMTFLRGISEERSRHRYAPDKWSLRQVVSHVNDTERVLAFRAFWFARGFESSLPSFEQDVAVGHADADARAWSRHVEEFSAIRTTTLDLFRHLPTDAWARRGIASDNPFTVRALAYLIAGHVTHHLAIVRTRYL